MTAPLVMRAQAPGVLSWGPLAPFEAALTAAALLAGVAAWVYVGAHGHARLRQAGVASAAERASAGRETGHRATFATGKRAVVLAVVVAWALLAGGAALAVCLLGAAGAAVGLRFRAERSKRLSAAAQRQSVIDACVSLTACLRSGVTAEQALARAAQESPALTDLLGPVVAAARFGGDVPAALARQAALPGASGLRRVAGCWQVAAANGTALGETLDRLGRGLRDDEAYRREIEAQLAGPRATARLLGGLPFLGLLLGALAGANPVRVLFGTGVGLACLVVGGGLLLAGIVWMGRLASSAELGP